MKIETLEKLYNKLSVEGHIPIEMTFDEFLKQDRKRQWYQFHRCRALTEIEREWRAQTG